MELIIKQKEGKMAMLYFKKLDKMIPCLVTLTILLFSIFTIDIFSKEPIFEYLFNEIGKSAFSSGSDETPLVFKIIHGVEEDLHTGGGLGVSGSPNDRAFDNYSWYEPPSPGGFASHEEINSLLPNLQSLTIQGWFKTDRTPASYVGKPGTHNEAMLIMGPFILAMPLSNNISLTFRVGRTGVKYEQLGYTILNEWVFFSITYDKTKPTNNINFYVGTKKDPVTLVSTYTLDVDFRDDLIFGVGALKPGYGMFYGLLDNIRLYGSNDDATGVLSLEELENIRTNDLMPVDSEPSELDKELENQLLIWENQLQEYEVEVNEIDDQNEYVIELKRKVQEKIASLHEAITTIRSRQFMRDFEESSINSSLVLIANALFYLQNHTDSKDLLVSIVSPISEVPILPYSNPADDLLGVYGTLGDALYVVATPGEYEPASFVVKAISDFNDLQVEITDLKMGASKIDASNIDVKVVKCWYQAGSAWKGLSQNKQNKVLIPELLLNDDSLVKVDHETKENYLKLRFPDEEKYIWISDPKDEPRINVTLACDDFPVIDSPMLLPVDIPSDTHKQFWVTVKIPENAPPGVYKGCIKLHSNRELLANLSLFVRVLPFKLAEPYYDSSIYYRGILNPTGEAVITSELKSEMQLKKDLENMYAHGVTNPRVLIGLKNPQNWKEGADLEELERILIIRESVGMGEKPLQLAIGYYNLGFSIDEPITPKRLDILKRNVRSVLEVTDRYNIPVVYFYGIDEAKEDRLISQKVVWEAIQEAGGKVNVSGYIGHFDQVGDTLDMLICAYYPDENEAEKWHSVGKKIYNYANPHGGIENPEIHRRNYGLLLWKHNYDGACNFAYEKDYGNIWNDFDSPHGRDLNYTYPTLNGPIDTIAWEGYREGVDDVRYITTLMHEIEATKGSDNIELNEAAVAAEQYLLKLKQNVKNCNLDIVRLEVINHILNIIKLK